MIKPQNVTPPTDTSPWPIIFQKLRPPQCTNRTLHASPLRLFPSQAAARRLLSKVPNVAKEYALTGAVFQRLTLISCNAKLPLF